MLLKNILESDEKTADSSVGEPSSENIKYYLLDAGLGGEFEDMIEQINVKAAKYGSPPLKILEKTRKVVEPKDKDKFPSVLFTYKIEMFPVRIDGWDFVGAISHEDGGNIILSIGGGNFANKLQEYLHASNKECDYCHSSRDRTKTYVIYNKESGEFKRVGRNCLKKFISDSAEVLKRISFQFASLEELEELQWLKGNRSTDNDIDGEDGGPRGSRGLEASYDVIYTLYNALVQIQNHGFNKASEGTRLNPSTATRIVDSYEKMPYNDQSLLKKVDDMIQWVNSLPEDKIRSDTYLLNLKTLVNKGLVKKKYLGFLASLPIAYKKYMENQTKKELENENNKKSEFVGSVGSKIPPTKVTVYGLYTGTGQYGTYQIVKMRDNDGNLYTWFNTSSHDMEQKQYIISGTVKKHEEFNNSKITVLTRVKYQDAS